MLSTGVPAWPNLRPGYNLLPVFMVLVGLLVARFFFQLRLTGPVIGAVVLGGTLTAWLADAIGVLPATGLGLLVLAVSCAVIRRHQPR